MLAHFQAVSSGRTVARPGFWPLRIRIGLWWAGIAAAIAALGFVLDALQADLGEAPMIMAVAGTVAAPGGLLVALIAWLSHRGETAGRRRVFRKRIGFLGPTDGRPGPKLDAERALFGGHESDRAEHAILFDGATGFGREHARHGVAPHRIDEERVAIDRVAAERLARLGVQ